MDIFKNLKNSLKYLERIEEFERECMLINYERAIPLMFFLYIMEWIVCYYGDFFLDVGKIVFKFQIFSTLMIPIAFYCYKKFDSLSMSKLKLVLYTYTFGVLILGIGLVFASQKESDLLHVFIMIILAVGSILFIRPRESAVLVGIPTIIFIVGISHFQSNPDIVNIDRINVTIFSIIVWLLSVNIFGIKIKDLCLQQELEISNNLLTKLSKTDRMTGINNHESIIEILGQEILRSERYGDDLAIMLFDIDDFKKVNDTLGHLEGDKVIIKLADIMRKSARITDHLGRYGGEEFLIIMPKTDGSGAEYLYERIRNELKGIEFSGRNSITISAGIAVYKGEDINGFIRKADNNLYTAKRTGKDRCILD